MRKITAAIGLFAISVFFILTGCNQSNTKTTTPTTGTVPAGPVQGAKIAYVNIDTLESKYELLKARREDFKKQQEQMEGELQRSFAQMQTDAQQVQKKAEANTLTQSEYEAAQKRLNQMQQSLQQRKESLTERLMKEQEEFNKELKTKLDAFLDDYNKSHNYDYILSYSYSGSPLLYVNKRLDITKDVVDGMNALAKNEADKKSK